MSKKKLGLLIVAVVIVAWVGLDVMRNGAGCSSPAPKGTSTAVSAPVKPPYFLIKAGNRTFYALDYEVQGDVTMLKTYWALVDQKWIKSTYPLPLTEDEGKITVRKILP